MIWILYAYNRVNFGYSITGNFRYNYPEVSSGECYYWICSQKKGKDLIKAIRRDFPHNNKNMLEGKYFNKLKEYIKDDLRNNGTSFFDSSSE